MYVLSLNVMPRASVQSHKANSTPQDWRMNLDDTYVHVAVHYFPGLKLELGGWCIVIHLLWCGVLIITRSMQS